MVKRIMILLFVILCNKGLSQEEQELWWVQNSSNEKYEKNYKYAFSKIQRGVLKEQILSFIKNHILHKKKSFIAVEVSSIFSEKKDEKLYNITYISDYYNFVPYLNINQITEVQGIIVFIIDEDLEDFRIDEKVLFGLLRDVYKKEVKLLNKQYKKLKKEEEGGVPFLFPNTEHQIPNYILTIKDNKLIDKKVTFE